MIIRFLVGFGAGLNGTIPLSLANTTGTYSLFSFGGNDLNICANANETAQTTLTDKLSSAVYGCTLGEQIPEECPNIWPEFCFHLEPVPTPAEPIEPLQPTLEPHNGTASSVAAPVALILAIGSIFALMM